MSLDTSGILPPQTDTNGWIVANPMQYGYYRVNYETQNWNALINQLNTAHTVSYVDLLVQNLVMIM